MASKKKKNFIFFDCETRHGFTKLTHVFIIISLF